MAVDGYSNYIETLYLNGKLCSLPFIGKSIEKNIVEIIENKNLSLIKTLLGNIPDTLFDLYEYASIKDRLLKKLVSLGVFSFISISNMLEQHEQCLSLLERKDLHDAIKSYETRSFQYAHVYELAEELILFLQSCNLVDNVSLSDDLYLGKDSVKAADIICTLNIDINIFMEHLQSFNVFRFISSTENSVILERYGINFIIHILLMDEYNNKISALEIQKRKTVLSSETDLHLYGDLHLHTNWSDGLHSIEQMRDMALELGYSYIAITDHSQSLKPSGMSELDILMQIKEIRKINGNNPIPVLSGIEVDILADGSLDIPDVILKEFDIVIASIHSHFNQPPLILIDRMSKALSNKYVNILAHPTGRLLGRPGKPTVIRKGMELDFDYLLQLCKDNNVALEINCFPERFDLPLVKAIKAVSNGIKISIGTDSHSIYHMNSAKYAITALKNAGFPKEAILNCQPIDKLMKILEEKRSKNIGSVSLLENKPKNFEHYFSSNNDIIYGTLKVVGIDLTSSEKKASGFAVLSGKKIETMPVLTDDEMIKRIYEIKPAIISIDSPLSLPEGRCCSNRNCKCSKNGIIRYCEILLMHFGIGIYPCLIDSMVNLTTRGMNLSNRLRSLNFNVIESYPGVTQDLLQIPRKRRGLELLLNGMKNFGVEGIRDNITHDEADAITSALVGYFYLDNRYVGIGNEKEGYLIVPQLETDLYGKGLIIGLVGQIAAGKTTIAEYLRFKHGFISMRFSKLIEEKYNVYGRDALQRVGNEIANDSVKQKELSDLMISKIKEKKNYVIDGIRQIVDYENLSSSLGNRLVLLYIDAPFNARKNRYCKLELGMTAEKFKKINNHPVEMSIIKIISHCNHTINNNKGYKELMHNVDLLLKKINI
jgi:histidinol phosphatase-like PHP family hydrolase/predicted nuclease with RNAse H fold/dephospho-CoA kinase